MKGIRTGAEKVAKEAPKQKKRECRALAKEGGPSKHYLIKFLNQIPRCGRSAPTAYTDGRRNFNIGDLVRTIPDTTPGVHPSHSEAVCCRVFHIDPLANGLRYSFGN